MSQVADIILSMYNIIKEMREKYLTPEEFYNRFPDENSCQKHLFSLKYPDGFICSRCNSTKYYQLNGTKSKRNRILECASCKKQESLTSNTIFHGTRTPLKAWFSAFYYISQNKKGISSYQLHKWINVNPMTSWLILSKIRKSMEEDCITYQIGGEGCIVQADEIDIGGIGSEKQKVLVLLEKDINGKNRRLRFAPLFDKTTCIVEQPCSHGKKRNFITN